MTTFKQRMSRCIKYLGIRVLILGFISVLPFVIIRWFRPPQTMYTAEIFQGVVYTRQVRSIPRVLMVHSVEIDLAASGIDFLVTPGEPIKGLELPARATSAFLEEFGVQIAMNGSFFEPFRVGRFLWDYYPHSDDPVNVSGLAISNGHTYSENDEKQPVFCFKPGYAEIRQNECPIDTSQALAGNRVFVNNGRAVVQEKSDSVHPRTAVAVDAKGTTVWFLVVDGRQSRYSEGVTLAELAEIALNVGVDTALNLDGGGSSTLVMAERGGSRVLNAPIHKRIPLFERPVANHIGVYAHVPGEKSD